MTTKSILRVTIWAVLVLVTAMEVNAQTVTGCVIFDGGGVARMSAPIYVRHTGELGWNCVDPNNGPVRAYDTPGSKALSTYCITIPNVVPESTRNCTVGNQCGNIRTVDLSGINCNLDGSVPYIVVALSMLGVFFIRRRPK